MNLDEAFEALRKLSRSVPRPRSLPTRDQVSALECGLGISLPADLRRYLLEASDVVVGTHEPVTAVPGSHTYFGTVVADARDLGVPTNLIPVCSDNGNYYCLTEDGSVVYWDHNGRNDERWANLASWIEDVWIGGN